jgi:preprotein translocase subunit SecE
MQSIILFFREARGELAKVAWPSRRDIIRNTLIVIAVSMAVAFFLGGLDYVLSLVLKAAINR